MCGLAGIVGVRSDTDLRKMLDAISHRGPDDVGIGGGEWFSAGMHRLAIRDREHGNQPLRSEANRVQVFLNGEIYNYKQLRQGLAGHYRFASDCDTEVVLAIYLKHGLWGLRRLEGMFCVVVFDADCMYAIRDRFGIKPLYFATATDRLWYCSEKKGLLQVLSATRVDLQSAADVAVQGYPSDHFTHIEGVKSLPPGSLLTVNRSADRLSFCIDRFFERPRRNPTRTGNLGDYVEELRHLLVRSISLQTAGEIACNFALSGGVDSAALVALAATEMPALPRVHCVADAADNPDLVQARSIAGVLGCSLHESLFSYSDYCRSVATSVWIEERPSSLSALPFGFLAQSMSATSKIAISGEGSDELFAGYTCYVEGPVRAKGRLAQVAKLRAGGLDPRSTTVLAAERESQTKPGTDYAEAMLERIFWERLQFNHLELADRYFMAFGVECRVPFLDEALVDYAFSLPQPYKVDHAAGIQKVVLRCLLAGLHPVMAFSSLRRKQGLPGAASRHARRLTAELEGYVAQYQTDEARRVGLHGPRALSWDLFHAIHLEGRGARPDPLLAYRFVQAQGIQLGGSSP